MCEISRTLVVLSVAAFLCGNVMAEGIISLNFVKNSDETFVGGENIGPLATSSANWNSVVNRSSGSETSGSMLDLKDDDGNATTADVTWQAAVCYYTSAVYTNDQQRLTRGYLDDGNIGDGLGLSIVVSNIPYAQYRVYGLLASDKSDGGAAYTTRDFQLNGSVWVFGGLTPAQISAYGNVTANFANKGSYWSEIGGGVIGNYWTQVASGPTLVVRGSLVNGIVRGSLAAVIIQQINVPRTISINLAQSTNQDFADGSGIGPLATDSATWNSTINQDSGDLANGSKTNLIDVFGNQTGASVLWKSNNTYWNQVDGVADDQHKLAVGYLDDGNASGTRCSVTFSNIPYASYRLYGLLSSDDMQTSRDVEIDGMWARGGAVELQRQAHRSITTNYNANGEWWTETGASVTGNYWTVITCGSNLTVQGQNRIGTTTTRGSLAGIVIEEVTDWYVPSNRTVGFNFRGSASTGSMDFNAVAGAPLLQQRYWGNLNSDYFGAEGGVPARYFDSLGDLVGKGNITNNGIRLEFDANNLYQTDINATLSPDHVLMWGYMDSNAALLTQPYIQIWNIPYKKFDIVLYVDGDGIAGTKCGAYWLEEATIVPEDNGADLTPLIYTEQIGSLHFDGTYTQVPLSSTSAASAAAGNTIVFTGMTHSDITIRGMQESGTRAPINAFQIVDQSPPPPPLYPMGTILMIQ